MVFPSHRARWKSGGPMGGGRVIEKLLGGLYMHPAILTILQVGESLRPLTVCRPTDDRYRQVSLRLEQHTKARLERMSDKIKIFRETFHGRQDIVPRYWISKDGTRQGYTPLCKNEWKPGICSKPCRTCQNADYIPLTDALVVDHLKGKHILGVYPLLKNNTCHFIAGDFDNHNGDRNPLKDVIAFIETCQMQDITAYALRSKSGKGYHVYIIFNAPVVAWKARAVTFALLQEAGVIGDDIELSSFDRLFPNQDELSGKEFGNLIALPFQCQAAKNGHTLFLNPESGFTTPYPNQWEVLQQIKRIDETVLDGLITSWNLEKIERKTGGEANPEGWLLEALMGVDDGKRDVTGAKIAGYFLDKLPKEDIITILLAWNAHNRPPLNEPLIHKIVDSVYSYKKGNADGWEINLHFAGREKSGEEAFASG